MSVSESPQELRLQRVIGFNSKLLHLGLDIRELLMSQSHCLGHIVERGESGISARFSMHQVAVT
jgi:hypothetical protein